MRTSERHSAHCRGTVSVNHRSFVRSVAAGALDVPDTLRALPSSAGAGTQATAIVRGESVEVTSSAYAALAKGQQVRENGASLRDDNLWRTVRASYDLPSDIVNFDSGAVNTAPVVVQSAEARDAATAHTAPTHFMNRLQ